MNIMVHGLTWFRSEPISQSHYLPSTEKIATDALTYVTHIRTHTLAPSTVQYSGSNITQLNAGSDLMHLLCYILIADNYDVRINIALILKKN